MDEDTLKRPKPKPHKVIIILDGERPCYIDYVDAAQEKQILDILLDKRRRLAQ